MQCFVFFFCLSFSYAAAVDIVLAVPTHDEKHFILDAGRVTWRKKLFTVVSTNGEKAENEIEQSDRNEVWVAAPDGGVGWERKGGNKAEGRCVGLVRIVNTSASVGLYNWLLKSDDEVVWYEDNVRAFVNIISWTQIFHTTSRTGS